MHDKKNYEEKKNLFVKNKKILAMPNQLYKLKKNMITQHE
jgi:hypothetical protein